MNVTFLFRKRLPGFHSIEELFYNISRRVGKELEVMNVELPYSKFSFKAIINNFRFVKKNKTGVFHITGHVNYLALATGKRTVLTIHDIQSSFYGGFIHQFFIKVFWYWLPALIVKRITVISEFSKFELEKIIPFAKQKIKVIYNPLNDQLKYSPKKINETCPKILLLGTKPNKNLERSLNALVGIQAKLLIVGKLSQEQSHLLQSSSFNFENFENLPYEQIIELYMESDMVLFPSTYEGFGMPIIEAQAIGRPVITSDFGAMKEVAGEGACFINPNDEVSIREGTMKIIKNAEFREDIIKKGKGNAERFSLEKIAQQYLNLYKEI
ncbi:glycosyltransferase family 4 protein [Mangrovimonas sp. AS39]|uniref:glycosyltransferase family 4 protein n=1 Tax=Mangrovimonas futianensis TaxID=2895523 RepID=UPI001E570A4B|nr:glycosyltransferase family 1 protein [Mangrovimonas futianensis]MCF1190797.1 glycosyltransferase family 4 protein [Mangrovimonas futianensis]MCF1194494.1 glycosyltransferase family 4 protein [Mangrovimonas futianensis]